jgi:hypothetical protein
MAAPQAGMTAIPREITIHGTTYGSTQLSAMVKVSTTIAASTIAHLLSAAA